MVTIEKCEFGQLNDKRYILPDGISSLPYGHKDLTFIQNFKDDISLLLLKSLLSTTRIIYLGLTKVYCKVTKE